LTKARHRRGKAPQANCTKRSR